MPEGLPSGSRRSFMHSASHARPRPAALAKPSLHPRHSAKIQALVMEPLAWISCGATQLNFVRDASCSAARPPELFWVAGWTALCEPGFLFCFGVRNYASSLGNAMSVCVCVRTYEYTYIYMYMCICVYICIAAANNVHHGSCKDSLMYAEPLSLRPTKGPR